MRLDELFVDVSPEGRMLVLSNVDAPGLIGRVGSLLGEHGINIADMRVGCALKKIDGIRTVRWVVL